VDEFAGLSLSLYEDQIIDEFVLTFDDAKMIFLSAQNLLNKAKEYYTSENEASEYAIIVQDLAALYKCLAFFDDDDDNQCKLHKRRAERQSLVAAPHFTRRARTMCTLTEKGNRKGLISVVDGHTQTPHLPPVSHMNTLRLFFYTGFYKNFVGWEFS
jgi:KIF-1 binding protein C terminal